MSSRFTLAALLMFLALGLLLAWFREGAKESQAAGAGPDLAMTVPSIQGDCGTTQIAALVKCGVPANGSFPVVVSLTKLAGLNVDTDDDDTKGYITVVLRLEFEQPLTLKAKEGRWPDCDAQEFEEGEVRPGVAFVLAKCDVANNGSDHVGELAKFEFNCGALGTRANIKMVHAAFTDSFILDEGGPGGA